MVTAICHEPFYETGIWIDVSAGIYAGWTAIPGSFSARMPVENPAGEITLIFSGDEYGEDTEPALPDGPSAKTTPAARLLSLYEGNDRFPARLCGLFHGLLYDRRRHTALLFNDRYGMHRLYYHETADALYFAAEAKAILAVLPALRQPDLRSLGEFVSCSCVLEDRTLFEQIHALPAGSVWTLQDGAVLRKENYFHPREWEEETPLSSDQFHAQMRDVLSRRVPRYFDGEEHTGVALTGGLDTRMLLAWCKATPGALPCYTFGGMFRDCRDVRVAGRVARQVGQSHQVIEVGEQFLKQFPYFAERTTYLTEGGVDVYRAPDLYVSSLARQIAPAKVVGTYGSEFVRHAVMFKPMAPVDGLFRPLFLPQIEQAKLTYFAIRRGHPVTFAAFKQSPWYHSGVLSLEQTQLSVRSPFLDNEFVRTVFHAPRETAAGTDIRLQLIRDGDTGLSRIPSDRGIGGNSIPVLSSIFRAWLEFSFKAEYAYDYGMPQWVCRTDRCLSALHLERLFIGRHKFSHFRIWYRDWLGDYVRQILLDPIALARPYVEPTVLTRLVQDHVCGRRNYTSAIHKLLTMELLHRQFFDPQ